MYKLVVISGPNTGTSYLIRGGSTTIGRSAENSIVLKSHRISKKHCSLELDSTSVRVTDLGSSNGTFVNGVLIKSKVILPGDRLSMGEFVFQVVKIKESKSAASDSQRPNTFQALSSTSHLNNMPDFTRLPQERPQDFFGKINWVINHTLMPSFYGILMKTEWKVIYSSFIGLYIVLSVLIASIPLINQNRNSLIQEVKARAHFMSRQLAEQNARFFAAGAETRSEIGWFEQAQGVQNVVLVDLDSRILAPSSRLNQYLTSGFEAASVIRARDLFRAGRETGVSFVDDTGLVVSIEPIKVLNPNLGRNVIVAMAVVAIDATLDLPGSGEIGVSVIETLIISAILGLLIFSVLYKINLRPFVVLNEDMDRALKGELPKVTHEYQFEELNSLWEIINSAIQRIPMRTESGNSLLGINSDELGGSPEEFEWPIRMLGGVGKLGLVAFSADKKIVFINPIFEEISGIRPDAALGQSISSVARDQSLGLLVEELLDRVATGSEGVSDDFEFSGIPYRVLVSAFGAPGQSPKFFLMACERKE